MIDILNTYAALHSGNLEIVYVRYDERADKFYCTLKPHRPLIPELAQLPNRTTAALAQTNQ